MAKVPNAIEMLPKITTAWVGCTSVTDDRRQTDRQTTDRQTTDGRATTYSERAKRTKVHQADYLYKNATQNMEDQENMHKIQKATNKYGT